MFFRKEINPFPVADRVTFRNIDKTLTLSVRSGAADLVLGIKRVQERLLGTTDETPDDEYAKIARIFAETIFGKEQGEQLMQFYGSPVAVIAACGMYFKERLSKKIAKAQKNAKAQKK